MTRTAVRAYAPVRRPATAGATTARPAQPATTARPVQPAARVAQPTPVARRPVRQTQLARAPAQAAVSQPVAKSNEMLALEALERMPVPEARRAVPATAAKPATRYRSAEAAALDALMQN